VTTLAVLPQALKELFERIDAAEASTEHLRRALDFWKEKRRAALYPTPTAVAEMPEEVAHDAFVFERVRAGKAGWRLARAGAEARKLMRPADGWLRDLGNKQVALRLERLFEWVAEAGEPVAADFELERAGSAATWCEVLAAPLSSDGETVDAIFGGLVARQERR
jgi:ribose-phosphate pyrophosphokinase